MDRAAVKFSALKSGYRAVDLTGKKFKFLTVVDFSHRVRTKRVTRLFWNCRCECGNVRQVSSYHLTNNEVKSCGQCPLSIVNRKLGAKNTMEFGLGDLRRFYRSYQANAKIKDRVFDLTLEQFRSITIQDCHYCGTPAAPRITKTRSNGHCTANGMDRINSELGYIETNIVPCCSHCNTMKLDMTYDEFKAHIKRIYSHLKL